MKFTHIAITLSVLSLPILALANPEPAKGESVLAEMVGEEYVGANQIVPGGNHVRLRIKVVSARKFLFIQELVNSADQIIARDEKTLTVDGNMTEQPVALHGHANGVVRMEGICSNFTCEGVPGAPFPGAGYGIHMISVGNQTMVFDQEEILVASLMKHMVHGQLPEHLVDGNRFTQNSVALGGKYTRLEIMAGNPVVLKRVAKSAVSPSAISDATAPKAIAPTAVGPDSTSTGEGDTANGAR